MKKFTKIILVSILGIAFIYNFTLQVYPLENIILKVIRTYDVERGRMLSFYKQFGDDNKIFWIDRGVRERYYFLKHTVMIGLIEKLVGVKIYKSGPQIYGDINYGALNDFGHYNPEFLELVLDKIK